ncbi:MAG: 3-deoxy-D-manno-octulosonic acid transferase, partial [Thermoanaerobaculia bacterium]|nr:3-deoxy-D-manno-octulosonic acid transferase [Thermoanaerobaculia bacterium]
AVLAGGEAVVSVADEGGAADALARLLADPGSREAAREAAGSLFARHRGATRRTVRLALDLLDGPGERA